MKRFGAVQRKVIDALKGGAPLHRFFENDACIYFIEGMGEIQSDSVKRLIERKALVENQDGMFGVGATYSLAEGVA